MSFTSLRYSFAGPTLVAEGTHRMSYYKYRTMQASRITSGYVNSHFRVSPMVGKAGGGFIFDTNSLHRGMHEGNHTRTTILLEFHRLQKIPKLKELRHDGPCPTIHSRVGQEGHPLYMTEEL